MKFKKILMLGYSGAELDRDYWDKLHQLCEKRILVSYGSPEVSNNLDADCLTVKFSEVVDRKLIDSMPNLKYIGTMATAFGRIDVDYAKKKGIVVCNVPGYSTISVAEFAFGIILEHLRDLERGKKVVREGIYSESGFSASELNGKTFGIIGLGSIGGRIAEVAQGFGCKVIYWSRNRKPEFENKGIKYQDIDALLRNSDFISINISFTKETEKFFDKDRINNIKNGAVVINLAPMDLIDLETLEDRLKSNDMTFIYDHSDELSKEWNEKFVKYNNCIIYPPIGWISKEGRIRKEEIFINNLKGFLEGNVQNKVN